MSAPETGAQRFEPRASPCPIAELAALASARVIDGNGDAVTGVAFRAQQTRPNDLFAALPGASTHGAQFARIAVEAGATAILTDSAGLELVRAQGLGLPVLCHEHPRLILGVIAAAVYGNPSHNLDVVGVTGTSGKTTTTYLIEAGLRAAGRRVGLIGTVGIRVDGAEVPSTLTTPEAPALQELLAEMLSRGVDTVVMEVSSHALALSRVDGIRFGVTAFTNLSRDHLDFHADMEDYFATKALLFKPDSPLRAPRSVICIDDEAGRAMADLAGSGDCIMTTVSVDGPADWSCADARTRADGGQEFAVQGPRGAAAQLEISLPGRYNVANSLVAVAVIDALGISVSAAASGIARASVPGRMEPIDAGQDFLAIVDYAHKPGALRAVLETLRTDQRGRLAVVFGAGGNRDRGKRAEMGRVAAELADLVVVTDDNPRDEDPASIRAEIVAGAEGTQVVEIGDRRAAIEFATRWAQSGDTVLVAGKGHESGQKAGAVIVPFDDRVELRLALETSRRQEELA